MYKKQFRSNWQRGTNKSKKINRSFYIKKAEERVEKTFIPKHNFSDFLISDDLKQNILEKGYTTPTPIQDEAIEPILLGKDIIGLANTGTGKTAAFLIPLINKVLYNRSQKILVVVPTRELAVQIQEEFIAFTKDMNVYSVLCIGGVSIYKQIHNLRRDHDIVIATPGRIKDLEKQLKDEKQKVSVLEQKLRLRELPAKMRGFYALQRIINQQSDYLNDFVFKDEISKNPKDEKTYDRASDVWEKLAANITKLNALETELSISGDEAKDTQKKPSFLDRTLSNGTNY